MTIFECKNCMGPGCEIEVNRTDGERDPELCLIHSGCRAVWKEIIEEKPVVDEQKKRWAEKILDAENYCSRDGYKCPFECDDFRPHRPNVRETHSENCPVTEVKLYLEGLEGE